MDPQRYYWDTFSVLKRNQFYLNIHEQRLDSIERGINIFSAIASSAAIGGWLIWREYPFIWTAVIAASQILTAVKPFLPYGKRLKALGNLSPEMESLALTAETDWIKVSRGMLTEEQIFELATNLKVKSQNATHNHFKGLLLPENKSLLALADDKASTYLKATLSGD